MTDELKLYVTECIQGRDGYDVMHELVISLARESSKPDLKALLVEIKEKMLDSKTSAESKSLCIEVPGKHDVEFPPGTTNKAQDEFRDYCAMTVYELSVQYPTECEGCFKKYYEFRSDHVTPGDRSNSSQGVKYPSNNTPQPATPAPQLDTGNAQGNKADRYNETANILNEMDDLQNYLFEAIRDQDSLDQETCKLNLTKDSYLTEIVKQISIHRDQLSTERVQAILDMSISDNEKDELVQVVMKHSSDASDIIENFEKMDPNTADDYYRFRKFILELNDNEANNIEAQLSQSSQSNSARNGQGYVQENILQAQKDPNRSQGNISGKNQASNQEFGDDSDINVMNNLINQRNKPEQGLVLMPPSRQDSEHSRPAEVPVVSYNKNNPVVQNSKLDDSSHRSQKPIIQTPKSVKVKDIPAHGYIDDEDDLDFDIPGERSSRDNRNQYFQSNLNEHDYSPRDAQKHVHQPIKPASLNKDASPHSNYQVPENMFNRIPMEPQNQDESIDNFQIPEEKSRDIDVYDIKENNIDPVRLDMLEEDEPPAIVPVTGNFAFKKQLNIGQAVADNGEFKRFYEEKAYQNMGQIPEEPFEGESALSSNHKKASDLFAGSHQYKNSSFKQEELSKKSSPYERSADSYGGMKPLPTGAAPKFIASSLNDTKKQSYPLIDVPAIEHKPKIKGPSQMLSFSSPIKSNEDEDIEYQVGRGFKAPSPRLIWNPLTAPQPTEDQPVKLLIGNPTVQKIKEDQKQAPVQKAVEGTYTKEQVEKVVEDKLRTIESKYIGLEAEIAKLTEELKQKKSEENKYISYHDAKVNSFSSEDKPRSTIKLLKPARLGSNLAWINKNHEDRLKMQHEQSKMNISKQSMTNTMLDGVNDGDMDTVSKIVSFARGTTVTKTFELSGGKKGTLFQNDHIAVEIDIEHDLHIKDGNYYIKLKLEFRNKCTNEVGGIVPKILDPTQSFRILAKPTLAEFNLPTMESKTFSIMVCPKKPECSKTPELSVQYIYEQNIHIAGKIALPFGLHRFCLIQQCQSNDNFRSKIEKEVRLEASKPLQPARLLSILPGMTRIDHGQTSTATFSGNISYLRDSNTIGVRVTICSDRQTVRVAVDADDDYGKACHETLMQAFTLS